MGTDGTGADCGLGNPRCLDSVRKEAPCAQSACSCLMSTGDFCGCSSNGTWVCGNF